MEHQSSIERDSSLYHLLQQTWRKKERRISFKEGNTQMSNTPENSLPRCACISFTLWSTSWLITTITLSKKPERKQMYVTKEETHPNYLYKPNKRWHAVHTITFLSYISILFWKLSCYQYIEKLSYFGGFFFKFLLFCLQLNIISLYWYIIIYLNTLLLVDNLGCVIKLSDPC